MSDTLRGGSRAESGLLGHPSNCICDTCCGDLHEREIAALHAKLAETEEARQQAEIAKDKLLAALEWALPWLDKTPLPAYDQELRDIYAENLSHIRAAIAKAKGEWTGTEAKANARLIATAPTLLAALEEAIPIIVAHHLAKVCSSSSGPCAVDDYVGRARAAIAECRELGLLP